MLLLTRRLAESIIIGEDVKITVCGIRGNQVRLGIEAPKETSVHREEIYLKIKEDVPEIHVLTQRRKSA